MTIYFYTARDKNGYLSNFSLHGFKLEGEYWPTVEHYFQARKFPGSEQEKRIRNARTPGEAKRLGQTRAVPIRKDWESVKDDVMRAAVLKKFETHKDIRKALLLTGDEELIEKAPRDYYWGCGADGSGKNMLGKILMEIRTALGESKTIHRG